MGGGDAGGGAGRVSRAAAEKVVLEARKVVTLSRGRGKGTGRGRFDSVERHRRAAVQTSEMGAVRQSRHCDGGGRGAVELEAVTINGGGLPACCGPVELSQG